MYDLLDGMRVLEGSAFVAAPLGGMTLAQLGADVIRFDDVNGGLDHARWPLTADGHSLYWAGMNKGKRSILVDVRAPEGQELLADLLAGERVDPELLMAVALDLWSSPEGLLAFGQVLLSGGRAAEAQRVYADALGLDLDGELPWRLREGLAASWEARGRDRVALGCLAATFDRPGVGAGPLATGLFLAFEVGDRVRAEDLAVRLDGRFQAGSKRLVACGRSLAARRRQLRPGTWAPALGAADLFAELHAGAGASASLCRSFAAVDGGGDA